MTTKKGDKNLFSFLFSILKIEQYFTKLDAINITLAQKGIYHYQLTTPNL